MKFKYLIISLVISLIIGNNQVYATEGEGGSSIRGFDIPVEIPGDFIPGECDNCPQDTFKNQNFLSYAQTKFENKFPFDALGTIPTGTNGECLEINNQSECSLRDNIKSFINVLKYPIWITFLIGLIKVM